MRSRFRILLGLTICLVTANMALGQLPGGLGGLIGGNKGMDAITLVKNAAVVKELKITDEQLKKLPEAIQKALADVLTAEQHKRLKQIELQTMGPQAFLNTQVQIDLKMTEKQEEDIKAILGDVPDAASAIKGLLQDLKGGGGLKGLGEKLTGQQKETMDKCLAVLDARQQKQWTEMVGEEFKGNLFGGAGKGKGKKNE